MMSLTAVLFVRAGHRTRESHAKAHPAATETFLRIAGSASVRVVSHLREGAGDRKRLADERSRVPCCRE